MPSLKLKPSKENSWPNYKKRQILHFTWLQQQIQMILNQAHPHHAPSKKTTLFRLPHLKLAIKKDKHHQDPDQIQWSNSKPNLRDWKILKKSQLKILQNSRTLKGACRRKSWVCLRRQNTIHYRKFQTITKSWKKFLRIYLQSEVQDRKKFRRSFWKNTQEVWSWKDNRKRTWVKEWKLIFLLWKF